MSIMANIENLPNNELKELLIVELKSCGVDTDLIRIKVDKGGHIILRGEVYSKSEKMMILQTIMDETGMDDITNELTIIQELYVDLDDKEREERDGLFDEDDDNIGTEDIFRSIEEGIPYIPPTNPAYHESSETIKWKKKKKT